jgi:dipeptide/tripeptide permease
MRYGPPLDSAPSAARQLNPLTHQCLGIYLRSIYVRALRLDLQAFDTPAGAEPMWIMVVYVLIVVVSELIVVAIGLALDRIAPIASLPVSLTLFFAVLWFAWLLAIRWTEPKRGKKSKFVTEN